MSAVQVVPKNEIQPGDRVALDREDRPLHRLPVVTRLDGGAAVYIEDKAGERLVPLDGIVSVVRLVPLPKEN